MNIDNFEFAKIIYAGNRSFALSSLGSKFKDELCVFAIENSFLKEYALANKYKFHQFSSKASLYELLEKINKKTHILSENENIADKGEYKNFMSKEIFEQSKTAKNCINEYIDSLKRDINIYDFPLDPKKINKIILIGCGTAYHSCLVAKYWLEELTSIDIEIDIASEFRYRKLKFNKNNLYIFVSQSGETADTAAALDICKKNKVKTCSIINVVESTIARNSDWVLPIHAGPEIGVASTKAFTTQLAALMLLALSLAKSRNLNPKLRGRIVQALRLLPETIAEVLNSKDQMVEIAPAIANKDNALFLGRGIFYPIAKEGALKLKEISYIHAEAYPAGELKHGPLALIDENMPVIALAPESEIAEKLISNLEEVKARGGTLYVCADPSVNMDVKSGKLIHMPECDFFMSPIVYNIPLQILSYEVALLRGTDIDQPRNLAKSVTVE